MEKIKFIINGEDRFAPLEMSIYFNKINDIIDWVHKFEADSMWTEEKIVKNIEEVEDRLKTLEEDNALQKKMIKFIMKHSCFVANVKIDDETLQDLWDERNNHYIGKAGNGVGVENTEPTDKSEKIEEIIKELRKEFEHKTNVYDLYYCCGKEFESWLRDKLKQL